MTLIKRESFVPIILMLMFTPCSYADLSSSYSGGSPSCGKIVFNCDTHRVTVGGVSSPIDCGVSTPKHHSGRIGSRGRASGSRWLCLRNKPKVDLGLGPVIVHTPCARKGHERSPIGQNQTFKHSGCINVSPAALQALGNCQGAAYEIQYASKGDGSGNTRYARRRLSQQQYASVGNATQ